MIKITKLKIDHHYKNKDISNTFGVSTQGGMRRHNDTLVLISKIYKNIYPDQWHGNILNYTGMGRTGNQDINYSQNRTLNHSNQNGIHVYLFINEASNNYIYAGPVKLVKKPSYKTDRSGRRVIIFPITLRESSNLYQIKNAYHRSINYSVSQLPTSKLIKLVKLNENKGNKLINHRQKTNTYHYVRNRNVAELSKRFANGRCQLCGTKMFTDKRTHEPFLESHHINWLSHSGRDSIKNVIALCPNCHAKMHHADNSPKIVRFLKKRSLKLARHHGFN